MTHPHPLARPLGTEPRPARGLLPGTVMAVALATLFAGCTPTVRVEAPKEPIRIDLNITADVRVRVEEAVDRAITSNPDIF